MNEWMAQWYANVPAALNVNEPDVAARITPVSQTPVSEGYVWLNGSRADDRHRQRRRISGSGPSARASRDAGDARRIDGEEGSISRGGHEHAGSRWRRGEERARRGARAHAP